GTAVAAAGAPPSPAPRPAAVPAASPSPPAKKAPPPGAAASAGAPADATASAGTPAAAAPAAATPPAAKDDPRQNIVYLDLTYGRVVIKLRPDLAPNHVAQVKTLVKRGFYNGTPFHRVIEGFMAQGG